MSLGSSSVEDEFHKQLNKLTHSSVCSHDPFQTQALALTRPKSPPPTATSALSKATIPCPATNSNGLGVSGVDYSTSSNQPYKNHTSNNGRGNAVDDRTALITSPKSTSSNHSTRADFSGRDSNENAASPSTGESSVHMARDRSRSPPAKSQSSVTPINGSMSMNIKEELQHSPGKVSSLDSANTNLLAANYFANNHLKLAENLMGHSGTANFLNSSLIPTKAGSDLRTSPGDKTDDEDPATPLSTHQHHPMGGFERKDFDLSKVNGKCWTIYTYDVYYSYYYFEPSALIPLKRIKMVL